MNVDLLEQLFGFEHPPTRGERLHAQLYEAFLVGFMLLWCWQWAFPISSIHDVVRPQGLAQYVDIRPMFGALAFVNAVLVTAGAVLGISRSAPRAGYSVALLGFHLQYISRYALGEICHASNFVGTGMVGVCAAMWLFRDASSRRRFLVGASYFLIGLGYLSAALSKLIASGPTWVDGKNLWLWIGEKSVDAYSKYGVLELNWLQQHALESRAFATLLLSIGMLTELAGVLFWLRRTRPYAALACTAMHIGIYFSMNIMFDTSIYHVALLGLPWAALFDRVFAWRGLVREERGVGHA